MDKNLFWKILLIGLLVAAAIWTIYPLHEKLKPGLDIGGGSDFIYDFNTEGLTSEDIKGLAARNIPTLRERIDPQNMANIRIWPIGDTRVRIQLPMASAETIQKRKDFEDALEKLEKENVNLVVVQKALRQDKEKRQQIFTEFAGDSQERKTILDGLATTFDALSDATVQRDELENKLDALKNKIDAAALSGSYVEAFAATWSKLDEKALDEKIDEYTEDKPEAKQYVSAFVASFGKYADILNDIEGNLRVNFREAQNQLANVNLSIVQLKDVLQMKEESKDRRKILEGLKTRFVSRADKIDAAIAAYSKYAPDAGRLDDPEDLKRMLKGSGKLEFRILPLLNDGVSNQTELMGLKEALATKGPKLAVSKKYIWVQIEDVKQWKVPASVYAPFGEKYYVLACNEPQQVLLHGGEKPWKLKRANPATDSKTGWPAIGFSFEEIGSRLFYELTGENVNRPLAILLDDIAISAPNISEAIRGSGIITGEFTKVEINDMISKLNAGSFQASLSEAPVSEKTIGSTLGAENRDKGINAAKWGLIAVAAFMFIYYMLAGAIANSALFMNILFILAMMVTLRATFTLPGIAGLILTIGMSVDANVLIFERIREEQMRGSSLRAAIANGYQRAFRTILDANITTFFVALILYMVASEEIKGFAIVLMLGIASSMFTALVATRLFFNFLLDRRIIKEHLVMLKIIGKPNVDWMALRKVFFVISAVLIVGGMSVFFTRNEEENSKYDIEFTGGTSVQVDFKEGTGYNTSDVERIIHEKGKELGNLALQSAKVYSVGETGLQFDISTTETNKTTATVTFNDNTTRTLETVTADIEKAMADIGTLYNLKVVSEDSSFVVSTSLVNKARVSQVLTKAFGEVARITNLQVNEVVSDAVREAFAGLLNVRENLTGTITEADEITDTMPELADHVGGIKIACELQTPVTAGDLSERFKAIQFKPDTQNLPYYQFELLDTDLLPLTPDAKVSSFVYVSSHPEAAYRKLTNTEWQQFVTGEKTKVNAAVSLKESLSRVTQIDPSIGQQQQVRAIIAIMLSLIAIVIYIWIRFGTARYGFAAIAALVHDVSITLGAVAICAWLSTTSVGRMLGIRDFKINLEMIAAFLTIIGYSLNDTIVVFDRIRENRGKQTTLTAKVISNSINQTLSRTLLTSLTTLMVVLVMYIWGGAGLRGFTFAMLIGIIVGTYSSIAIAAPILLIGGPDKSKSNE